jgi:hypothetical protein
VRLDFTRDGFVSAFEFGVFLTWFGPLYGCMRRLLEPIELGYGFRRMTNTVATLTMVVGGRYLAGFVSAVEATLVLEHMQVGTFLIRMSKSQPTAFAVAFVAAPDRLKHTLLHHVPPAGLTLRQPPEVYRSLRDFVETQRSRLRFPLGEGDVTHQLLALQQAQLSALPSSMAAGGPFGIINVDGYGLSVDLPLEGEDTAATAAAAATASAAGAGELHGRMPLRRSATDVTRGGGGAAAEMQQESTCVVCLDRPPETVFLECAHFACCKICAVSLKQCPICRSPIVRVVPVFRPS